MSLNNHIAAVIEAYKNNDVAFVNQRMDDIVFEYLWSDVESCFNASSLTIFHILDVLKEDVAARYWCYIYYMAPKERVVLCDCLHGDKVETLRVLEKMSLLPTLKEIFHHKGVYIVPHIRTYMDDFLNSDNGLHHYTEKELML